MGILSPTQRIKSTSLFALNASSRGLIYNWVGLGYGYKTWQYPADRRWPRKNIQNCIAHIWDEFTELNERLVLKSKIIISFSSFKV